MEASETIRKKINDLGGKLNWYAPVPEMPQGIYCYTLNGCIVMVMEYTGKVTGYDLYVSPNDTNRIAADIEILETLAVR